MIVRKRKYYAFTLIELLAVIVILGILLGIGTGIYLSYLKNSTDRSYNIAENSFKDATMAAMEKCMAEGSTTGICTNHNVPQNQYDFELVYLRELIEGDFIDPIKNPDDTEEFCDPDKSYVYVSNRADMETSLNYDLYYKTCLVCGDRRSEYCDEEIEVPADFDTYCDVFYDEGFTTPYNGEWTDQDLYLRFTVEEGYKLGISRFLYKNSKESTWKKLDVREPSGMVHLTKDIKDKVEVKAYDDLNQVGSTAICGGKEVHIDKTILKKATLTAEEKDGKALANDTWADDDVILTVTMDPVKATSNYLYKWYLNGEVVKDWSTDSSFTATEDGTYKAEVTNEVRKQYLTTNEFKVKIDRTIITKATITAKEKNGSNLTTGKWTDDDVTLTATPTPDTTKSGYLYRWYKDGKKLNDWSSTNTYVATSTGKYKVEITNALKRQVVSDEFQVNIDRTVIKSATITGKQGSSAIASNKWAKQDVTLTATVNPKSTSSGYLYKWYKDGVVVKDWSSSKTYTATVNGTYKVEVTNGVRRQIITSNNFIVKIDRKTPTIAVGSNPLSLGNGDYNFTRNVTPSYGDSGGNISCNPATSRKTGTYTVTCTATSGSGLKSSVSFSVRHSYAATYVPRTCEQENCYTCSNPRECYIIDSRRQMTWCKYSCTDGKDRWNAKSYRDPGSDGWGGWGSSIRLCSTDQVDCSYYTCPNGGTLSGATCYY